MPALMQMFKSKLHLVVIRTVKWLYALDSLSELQKTTLIFYPGKLYIKGFVLFCGVYLNTNVLMQHN